MVTEEVEIAVRPRHAAVVRWTHWITVMAFVALLVIGLELVISHPRFYWGETGNVNMKPLFTLPIPSSRDTVPTKFGYVMPDQNGWSRYLHFEAAWVLLFAAAVYGVWSLWSGHLRRDLLPARGQRGWRAYRDVLVRYVRRTPAAEGEAPAYNAVQRAAYISVIFVLFPLVIWTGLAMSPTFEGAAPWAVELLGGRQSARTIHFFVTWALVLFLVVHVAMVSMTGFRARMRGMILGDSKEEV
jgi:thiosulfate reductase cytochrome b subunit